MFWKKPFLPGPNSLSFKFKDNFVIAEEILHACIRDNNLTLLRQLLGNQAVPPSPSPDINYYSYGIGPPLHFAASCGMLDAVDLLLGAGADPLIVSGSENEDMYTALGWAAVNGHRDICRSLWTRVTPERQLDNLHGSQNPLVAAAMRGHASLVDDFLDWWDGWTMDIKAQAFRWSARRWNFNVICRLLKRMTIDTQTYQEALHAAVQDKWLLAAEYTIHYNAVDYVNQRLLIEILIEAGADPNSIYEGRPLIHIAAHNSNTVGALKTLLEKGADPNKANVNGRSALHRLAFPISYAQSTDPRGIINETAIRVLLRHRASVVQPDEMGECPLHWAAFGVDLHLFRLYLSSSPDSDIALHLKSHAGETLLHFAALGDCTQTIEFLLARGLDVNARNNNGWTPLMCALTPNRLEGNDKPTKQPRHALHTARLLLSHGADLSVVTDEGWTPLHALALHYDDETSDDIATFTRDLISQGVDPEARAPLLGPDASRVHPQPDLPWGRRLVEAMGNPEASRMVIKSNLTPLHWAAERGAVGVIRGLLSCGVNVSSADAEETSPTRMAAESKFLNRGRKHTAEVIVKLLLDAGAGF